MVYEQIRKNLEQVHAGHPDQLYWLITLDRGMLGAEAGIKWCERSLAKLAEMNGGGGEPDKGEAGERSNCRGDTVV